VQTPLYLGLQVYKGLSDFVPKEPDGRETADSRISVHLEHCLTRYHLNSLRYETWS
jgi:hypothetical protein